MPDNWQLIWTRHAVEDVNRLRAFIRVHNPDAAQRAAQAIQKAAALLLQHPAIGHPVHDLPDFRDLFVPFGSRGYVLRYRFDGSRIIVIRVWHSLEERRISEDQGD